MKNVLVLCDSPWHPAEVIQMGFAPLEGDEFHFVFVKAAKDILTPERIAEYPLIICAKGNAVTEANNNPWYEETVTEVGPKEFEDYIRAGGGYIALHAGATGREGTPFAPLVGSTFNGHPLRCGIDVKITGRHPITEGVEDFHIRDEHYRINVQAQDAVELARSYSETGGEQVACFAREIGNGRLVMLAPGHCLDVYLNPQFKKLLVNAMRWAMRK